MAREPSGSGAKRVTKIDKVVEDLAELCTEVKQHGAEFAELSTEVKQLRVDLASTERRLTQAISTEMARGLGVIEERFVELFGLLDEKHSGAASELRARRPPPRLLDPRLTRAGKSAAAIADKVPNPAPAVG